MNNKYKVDIFFRIRDHYINFCPTYFDTLDEARAYVKGINLAFSHINVYIRKANAYVSGNILVEKKYDEVIEVI